EPLVVPGLDAVPPETESVVKTEDRRVAPAEDASMDDRSPPHQPVEHRDVQRPPDAQAAVALVNGTELAAPFAVDHPSVVHLVPPRPPVDHRNEQAMVGVPVPTLDPGVVEGIAPLRREARIGVEAAAPVAARGQPPERV